MAVIIDKDNKKRRVVGENSNLTYKFIRSGTFVLREFFKQYGFRECRELSNDFNIMWLNSHVKDRFNEIAQNGQKSAGKVGAYKAKHLLKSEVRLTAYRLTFFIVSSSFLVAFLLKFFSRIIFQ